MTPTVTETIPSLNAILRGFPRIDCPRCGGTGAYGPAVVYQGRCFQCEGTRTILHPGAEAAFEQALAYCSWHHLRHLGFFIDQWADWADRLALAGFVVQAYADVAAFEAHEAAKAAKRDGIAAAHARGEHAAKPRKTGCPACRIDIANAAVIARKNAVRAAYPEAAAILFDFDRDAAVEAKAITFRDRTTLQDIAIRAERYGEISEPQARLVVSIAARNAQRAAERAAAAPAPTGKVAIEGVIVGIKEVDSDYGTVTKWTIAGDAGWRIYVSAPQAIEEADRGDRVRLTCTITPSTDDPTFAFGKRPTAAAIITRAQQAEAVAK